MALLCRLCLCLCLPLLLPPSVAPAPAPTPGSRTDWAACRMLSRDLSRLLTAVKDPHSVLGCTWASQECPGVSGCLWVFGGVPDPRATPRPPQRCLHRIHQALQHYRDLLGSDIFRDQPQSHLETTMDQLLELVQKEHGHHPRHPMAPSENWSHQLLRHLALKRLQSFTAVMSRVFTHSAS
ncbi:IL23A protein, partial [Campylorhamphus procurvoides]|nr:IL23A protein [Campylorhamphus procurvoides]